MSVEAPVAPVVPAPVTPAAAVPATPAAGTPAATPAGEAPTLLGGSKSPETPGEPKPGEVKSQAPEKYADFKLPDGMTLDKGLNDKFLAVAKKSNLSQEQAQELVSLQAEHAAATMKAGLESWNQLKEGWKQETITDLGADKYEKELGFAAKALDRFGSPELRKLLDDTGLGSNKLLVKAWISIGKQMAEGGNVEGSRAGVSDPLEDTKRSMFPSMYNTDGSPKK